MNHSRDWQPSAQIENLRERARILSEIRAFFLARNVLEVDTPLLSAAASTDPYLDSFKTHYQGPGAARGRDCYLPTSPEFAMKRLLAAGSGPIYQICKSFRNGESGRQHNPEFTMLEWYRPDFSHHDLMDEVQALVEAVLGNINIQRISYRELFLQHVAIDPFATDIAALRNCLVSHDVVLTGFEGTLDDWLSLVVTHVIEPQLDATFVYDFPASQAMLARVRNDSPPVAERFELYVKGMELANGFHELSDASEQQRRFRADLSVRRAQGLPNAPMDDALLVALEYGLPDCAGVALGVDRLIMLALGVASIDEVIAFPFCRA